MSTTKKLTNITPKQIQTQGVQALADRPNVSAQYGMGGLSPQQLKLWFDKLPAFLAGKFNEIHDVLSSEDAGSYIRLALDAAGVENLEDLCASFINGAFTSRVLQVYPSAGSAFLMPLQQALNDIAMALSDNAEELDDLWESCGASISLRLDPATYELTMQLINDAEQVLNEKKVDLRAGSAGILDSAVITEKLHDLCVTTAKLAEKSVTSEKIADRAVITEKINDRSITAEKLLDGAVITRTIASKNVTTEKLADSAVTSAKIFSGAVSFDKLSANVANRFLKLENQAFIDLHYDPATGVLSFTSVDGTVESVDLPLELITSGGYYDDTDGAEAVVLVLANGQEIRIPVDDLLKELIGYINTIHDGIYTLQKAPPLAALNDAMLLPSPTLGQIAALT